MAEISEYSHEPWVFVWRACGFLDQLIVWPWEGALSSVDLLGSFLLPV